jgi:hypothetical protein
MCTDRDFPFVCLDTCPVVLTVTVMQVVIVLLRIKMNGVASDFTSLLNFPLLFVVFFACDTFSGPPASHHRK